MAVVCTLPDGTEVRLEDLPLSVWSEITKHAGLEPWQWSQVMVVPQGFPSAAVEVMNVCAEHVGQEHPDVGYLTGKTIKTVFTEVEDDLPNGYINGSPDPKVADPVTVT